MSLISKHTGTCLVFLVLKTNKSDQFYITKNLFVFNLNYDENVSNSDEIRIKTIVYLYMYVHYNIYNYI